MSFIFVLTESHHQNNRMLSFRNIASSDDKSTLDEYMLLVVDKSIESLKEQGSWSVFKEEIENGWAVDYRFEDQRGSFLFIVEFVKNISS